MGNRSRSVFERLLDNEDFFAEWFYSDSGHDEDQLKIDLEDHARFQDKRTHSVNVKPSASAVFNHICVEMHYPDYTRYCAEIDPEGYKQWQTYWTMESSGCGDAGCCADCEGCERNQEVIARRLPPRSATP